jgi:hypothetical protein
MAAMSSAQKDQLHRYLRNAREAMVWKLDGLSEYDVRRPLTPTGTNLLGLVKHLAIGEAWYFGQVFDRPLEPHLPWWDDDQPEGADLWATASESRSSVLDTYRAACAHADSTIDALDLDAAGHVPWWSQPDVTLHSVLVHVLAETARHAGHADILREQLDGSAGFRPDSSNVPAHDEQWWADHRAQVEAAARAAEARWPGR